MSIRAWLICIVAVAALTPAALFGLRSLHDREVQIANARANLGVVADALAQELDQRIRGTMQLLYGLARARDLETTDRAACSAFLGAVREQHPQYTGILTINPDGQFFCDSLNTGRELDLSDRLYFQQARAWAEQGHAAPVLQPAFGPREIRFESADDGVHRRPEGGLGFVLLASLNLQDFLLDNPALLQRGLELHLLDRTGMVLSNVPGVPMAGQNIADTDLGRFALDLAAPQTAELTGADGTTRILARGSAPATIEAGLRFLVGQPRAILVANANLRLVQELGVMAGVALLLAMLVWLLGERSVRRQLARIGAMAERLGHGDLTARIAPPHPGGDFGALMARMNTTADSLQAQRDSIAELSGKLLQAQRMEAVGQLTGGLAHDFNNLLTVILGSAELLEERFNAEPEPDALILAESIRVAAERGGELTRSLLAFARRQPLEPRPTDLGALISRMERLLRRTLGEPIRCHILLAPGLWPALVDPAQLEASLLNLALNARDAMPEGGVLTIETAGVQLDEPDRNGNEELPAGAYAVITMTDTGHGMTPEVCVQAFEPFFTTKEFGKGSGLGLSMVFGFARQSRGQVKLYSEPGRGTAVRLFLPRAEGAVPMAQPPPPLIRGGQECILVVEDDELVRQHVLGELGKLGYRTLSAGDGAAALDILQGGDAVDLLFTDVVMPGGMSGPQLAEAARRLRPGLKVLFTSGYSEHAVMHQGLLGSGELLLSKPYRRRELDAKLRQMLEQEPA